MLRAIFNLSHHHLVAPRKALFVAHVARKKKLTIIKSTEIANKLLLSQKLVIATIIRSLVCG